MSKSSGITPLRRQYLQIKSQYPDAIVLYRLGDFYETFDEDAKIVSQTCDIVLTSRPVGKNQRVPLAGVPYHAVEGYIAKLIGAGYKVAIVEQVGETQGRGLMHREVRRVITPGTVVEPALLEDKRNNYLAAVVLDGERAGLAYADITTGEFATTQLVGEDVRRLLREELERLQPAEVLSPAADSEWLAAPSFHVTPYEDWHFELGNARQSLLDHFQVASLAGFGCDGLPLAVRAAGALVQYLQETQRAGLGQLDSLRTYSTSEFMTLDAATRRNLELTETIRERTTRGSLLGVLDATVTAMGGRTLRRWINQPLLDLSRLNERLDAVQALYDDTPARSGLIALLKGLPDLERLTNRLVQRIVGPRDLLGIRRALEAVPRIKEVLVAGPLSGLVEALDPCAEVAALIGQAIAEDPPATLATGGVIRPGFSAELDGVVAAAQDAKQWVANLERSERQRTGIKSLKVGYNKVFGYYIEVTKANLDAVPAEYIRKQTLVNAERFITPELKEYESLILNAQERILDIETRLFREVCDQVAAAAPRMLRTARVLAQLDVYAALAEVALRNRYTRPVLTTDDLLEIKAGRHPVVELLQRDEPFVPNDVHLNAEERILVITGPNMSGKCVAGDTLVFTDQGLVPIVDLMPNGANVGEFTEVNCQVRGLEGKREATHFYKGGRQPTVKVTTRLGYHLEGTPEHKVWVRHPDGSEGWKQLGDIAEGDVVAIEQQIDLWGQETAIDRSAAESLKGVKRYRLPGELDEDLAYMMGLLVGDGTLTYPNYFMLSTGDAFIADEYRRIVRDHFGYEVGCKANGKDYFVTSKQIRVFLASLDLGYGRAHEKYIPKSILRSPKHIVIAFLQGLFDADGFAENRYGNVRLSTASFRLAHEVQLLLLNLGIIASLQVKQTSARPSYRLSINGADAIAFHQRVGFRLPRKKARKALADELITYCHQSGVECSGLEALQTKRYFYDYVTAVEPGEADVYDLSVTHGHAYVANGFVSHNSTYLRQVALIVLMAQVGSFVPADAATIGLVDRIFTRVGAQDELAAGRSTFMVEMVETANILHHATSRSLIILDEIGRGTSTYDGISIAWAVVEYIHNHPRLQAKTLFATHYHELTDLANILPLVRNYNVAVAEEGDHVVFLRKVVPGGADKSYGIHVAQLAGLPRSVVHRAEEILDLLEREASRSPVKARRPTEVLQLPLFATTNPVVEELKELDVTQMTPLEAITKLYELQKRAKEG